MSEKKEMTAVEFMKGLQRLCKTVDCAEYCPVRIARDNTRSGYCMSFLRSHPEEAVKVVEEWVEENPMKTLKNDFLEKYPDAPLINDRIPFVCARHLYPNISCEKGVGHSYCSECWDRPLEV